MSDSADTGIGRDATYLKTVIDFAKAVPLTATILRILPSFCRPVVAPFIAHFAHSLERKHNRLLRSTVLDRQKLVVADASKKPRDLLQWTMDRAMVSGSSFEMRTETAASRMAIINFAAIHTSTITITNTILDLTASTPANLMALRCESVSALENTGGSWSKTTVQKLVKHDSAIRESSRLSTIGSLSVRREVIAPGGLEAADGTKLPFGCWVAVAGSAAHYDDAYHPNAASYLPFRFCEDNETVNPEDSSVRPTSRSNQGFVTTSEKNQGFGHGKHACPGRFFAASELKLLLSYMMLKYDFQMLPQRPAGRWIGENLVPPMKATIQVRRRKEVV